MTILREINKKQQLLLIAIIFITCSPASYALDSAQSKLSSASNISVSVGLEYDTGDYGTTDTTDTWRVPVGVDYQKGAYFAGLSISYINTKSTGTITLSSGNSRMRNFTNSSSSTTSTTVSKASGMGDLNLYAGYHFPSGNAGKTDYSITAHIKLATADENKGLGTGENDYAIEAGLTNSLDKGTLFGSIGYQVNGDTATTNFDDIFYANAGISFPFKTEYRLGAMLDYAQAASPGFDDSLELSGFMNIPMENKRSVYLYALLGLSDGSPDYGIGMNYRFGL